MPGSLLLVAGVGNAFRGDHAFGCEVVRRLAERTLPRGVRVADFGLAGIHLVYELLDGGYDRLVLVDAWARGESPGTLTLLEPSVETGPLPEDAGESADPHGMDPVTVLQLLRRFDARPPRTLVLVCEPATTEWTMAQSEPVARAVDEAVDLLVNLAVHGMGADAEEDGEAELAPALSPRTDPRA
jgi:hydrogenase maturation protease